MRKPLFDKRCFLSLCLSLFQLLSPASLLLYISLPGCGQCCPLGLLAWSQDFQVLFGCSVRPNRAATPRNTVRDVATGPNPRPPPLISAPLSGCLSLSLCHSMRKPLFHKQCLLSLCLSLFQLLSLASLLLCISLPGCWHGRHGRIFSESQQSKLQDHAGQVTLQQAQPPRHARRQSGVER